VLDRLTAAVDRRSLARHRISEIERMIGTLVLAPLVLLESLRRTTTDGVPAIGRGQPRATWAGGQWSRWVRHNETSRAETHRNGRRRTESTAGRTAGNDANRPATTSLIRSLNYVIGVRIPASQPDFQVLPAQRFEPDDVSVRPALPLALLQATGSSHPVGLFGLPLESDPPARSGVAGRTIALAAR